MSRSMFQQNDRRLMSISIVHNDNSPMFQQISVVPSVCVDTVFLPCWFGLLLDDVGNL